MLGFFFTFLPFFLNPNNITLLLTFHCEFIEGSCVSRCVSVVSHIVSLLCLTLCVSVVSVCAGRRGPCDSGGELHVGPAGERDESPGGESTYNKYSSGMVL